MAKKRKAKTYKGSKWKAVFSTKQSPHAKRLKRRKMNKSRRSRNYWHSHGPLLFSKIEMLEVEKLWLEINMPHVVPTRMSVVHPHRFPSIKKGLWDGTVYAVEFGSHSEAARFKSFVWHQKL